MDLVLSVGLFSLRDMNNDNFILLFCLILFYKLIFFIAVKSIMVSNFLCPFIEINQKEVKAIKEIIKIEAIKSAKLLNRDKVKIKQNTLIGDCNCFSIICE